MVSISPSFKNGIIRLEAGAFKFLEINNVPRKLIL
jgi:hypothetical protein